MSFLCCYETYDLEWNLPKFHKFSGILGPETSSRIAVISLVLVVQSCFCSPLTIPQRFSFRLTSGELSGHVSMVMLLAINFLTFQGVWHLAKSC